MARLGSFWFLVSLVVGLYFINLGTNFVTLPESIPEEVGKWANIVGGVLIIIGGVISMNMDSQRQRYRREFR